MENQQIIVCGIVRAEWICNRQRLVGITTSCALRRRGNFMYDANENNDDNDSQCAHACELIVSFTQPQTHIHTRTHTYACMHTARSLSHTLTLTLTPALIRTVNLTLTLTLIISLSHTEFDTPKK